MNALMPCQVCTGATLQCSFGTAPATSRQRASRCRRRRRPASSPTWRPATCRRSRCARRSPTHRSRPQRAPRRACSRRSRAFPCSARGRRDRRKLRSGRGRPRRLVAVLLLVGRCRHRQRRGADRCDVGLTRRLPALNVLFIGGTGIISTAVRACSRSVGSTSRCSTAGRAACAAGRRAADPRRHPRPRSRRRRLRGEEFDVVVDWLAFVPAHVETRPRAVRGKISQYVFIGTAIGVSTSRRRSSRSSTGAARQPRLAVRARQDRVRGAAAAEHEASGFPATIVRPSHAYGETVDSDRLAARTTRSSTGCAAARA